MADYISGFQGAVAGLSLTDVIQLKGHHKYTGCITVVTGKNEGIIYFTEGEIVHAVQGNTVGEDAIYRIITWPGGSFNILPDIISNICTIHYRTDFLLLEALRRLDEERAGGAESGTAFGFPATERHTISKIANRLQEISGVSYAVLLDKESSKLQDTSIEATSLSRKSHFLAKAGNRLGGLMGLGDIRVAAVHTHDFQMLLYNSKQHYLSITIKPDYNSEKVEGRIKSTLMPGKHYAEHPALHK